MSETLEPSNDPTGPLRTETVPPAVVEQKPNRLYQVAAWVAIVAGTLFIVAVVFFSGFVLGRHSDGGDGHFRHHGDMMFDRGGPMGPMGPMGPGMNPGGPGGPQQGHRWPGPGNFGPGGPGAPGQPQPPAPTATPTR
ncbi:hypothetical protein [Mycobacterium sp. ACS4331]|uniref:hypothetical protein n=1 Tax=Mycobacterium sp. ACS4331 TaxID=1834121 RepID=UPI0007FF7489|nr:hypothetical protein [Mycobacterium sp. ACS4331]OBF14112.1 hypothetical protein A5727_16005 [Mycobacterium sp. ACS4331]